MNLLSLLVLLDPLLNLIMGLSSLSQLILLKPSKEGIMVKSITYSPKNAIQTSSVLRSYWTTEQWEQAVEDYQAWWLDLRRTLLELRQYTDSKGLSYYNKMVKQWLTEHYAIKNEWEKIGDERWV